MWRIFFRVGWIFRFGFILNKDFYVEGVVFWFDVFWLFMFLYEYEKFFMECLIKYFFGFLFIWVIKDIKVGKVMWLEFKKFLKFLKSFLICFLRLIIFWWVMFMNFGIGVKEERLLSLIKFLIWLMVKVVLRRSLVCNLYL